MKTTFLDFEQPIAELEARIEELRYMQDDSAVDISEEIQRLTKKSQALTKEIYARLTPWQVTQVARHPQRPYFLDYVPMLFTHFEELHGDRAFGDDPSIVGGLARFDGEPCVIIGHQKGRDTKEKILRNFGMPRPEGYRKALRLMRLAEKFGLPVFTLYGHVSRILVHVGESVTTGQVIAEVGQGGVALGPHLHLEVRVGSADYRDARNPYLWVTPDPGYGVIAGRVIDARGYVVPQQLVLLYRAEEPNRYWRETFTYPDNIVKSDPAWGELFAFGDIPVGAYVVKTRLDGKVYTQAISVSDRATSFVVFDARRPPTATPPPTPDDTPSSE